jgi:hypothetical protein
MKNNSQLSTKKVFFDHIGLHAYLIENGELRMENEKKSQFSTLNPPFSINFVSLWGNSKTKYRMRQLTIQAPGKLPVSEQEDTANR